MDMKIATMKLCTKCKEGKPLDQFHKQRAQPDGHKSICRTCAKVYKRQWYERNKQIVLEQNRQWRHNNKEHLAELVKRWEGENKDRVRQMRARWRGQSKEQIREYRARYRAALQNASGDFTVREWIELCEVYGNVCLCCRRAESLEVDHVIPLSRGGSNSIANIQPLCRSCNRKKYTHTTDYREIDAAEGSRWEMQITVHAEEEQARAEAREAVQEALSADGDLSVFIYKLRTSEFTDERGVIRGIYAYVAVPRNMSTEDIVGVTGHGIADTVGHIRTRNDEMKES